MKPPPSHIQTVYLYTVSPNIEQQTLHCFRSSRRLLLFFSVCIKVCIKPPTVRGAEEMRRRGHFRPQPLGLGPRLVPGPHLLLLLGHALHLDHVLPRDANLAVALLHRAARRLQRVTEVVSVRLSVTGGKGRRGADGASLRSLYTLTSSYYVDVMQNLNVE